MNQPKKQENTAKNKVLVILGPTSGGKTALGVRLASFFRGEIVSADSRQVYRGMDIGTGKDLQEYSVDGKNIPYHLIDVVNPNTNFDLAKYQRLAFRALEEILVRNNLPLIVGGTGLYLQALVDNYRLASGKSDLKLRAELESLGREELLVRLIKKAPEFAAALNNSDRNNSRRLARYLELAAEGRLTEVGKKEAKYDFLILGTSRADDDLHLRISQRRQEMIEKEGLIEEVKHLHEKGVSWKRLVSFGLEYKFVSWFLMGKIDYDTMNTKLDQEICQFAKRQRTWFKRWEGQGAKIHWVKSEEEARGLVEGWLKK